MLSPSWKRDIRRCACYALALALGTVVALPVCHSAEAQTPPPAAGEAQNPVAPAPSPPAPVAAKAPAPEKPAAPRLNRSYGQLPAPENEQEYSRQRATIQRMLRAGAIPAGEEQFFIDYYRKYALARWTFTDRQHEIAGYRRDLRNDLTTAGRVNRGNNAAHDRLVELVLRFMTTCVDPAVLERPEFNFSPATRFNAILMIGELNQLEAATGGRDAKPLPEAMPVLLDRATDPKQIDAVRLGALIGIRRHCRLMPENVQVPRNISTVMIDVLRKKESERVRSPEGQAWLRLIAIQTFADLKGKPGTTAVAKELLNVMAETDSPDFLRYAAAKALGSLNYRNATDLDMNVLLQALGLLAIEVCDEERQRLRDEMESKKTPMMPGGYGPYAGGGPSATDSGGYEDMMGGYGGMTAASTTTKEDRQIERARRRLKDGMTAALIGMGKKSKGLRRGEAPSGVSFMAGTDAVKTQNIESFSDAIHDFFKIIDTKDRDTDKQIEAKPLDEAIAEVRGKLADALSQVGAEAPESPELEPLPEPKPAGAVGGGYGEMLRE